MESSGKRTIACKEKYMKTMRILLICLLAVGSFAAPLGTKIDIEVTLSIATRVTIQDFESGDKTLFTIMVTNKTGEDQSYFIEVRLNAENVASEEPIDNPAFWIVTHEREIAPNSTEWLTNKDLSESDVWKSEYSEVLYDLVQTKTYLPAGNYDIKMVGWAGLTPADLDESGRKVVQSGDVELLDLSWDHGYVAGSDATFSWESDKAQEPGTAINNVLVNAITLLDPPDRDPVSTANPNFRWETPGFTSGVIIDYRIRIMQFDPDKHGSYNDALSDETAEFLDTDWSNDVAFSSIIHKKENGSAQTVTFQFPSGERDLACGYEYVWQVEAREYIEGYDEGGNQGIWGWPEPIKSEYRIFSFGSQISAAEILSPTPNTELSSVRPTFNWTEPFCASEYQIRLSRTEQDETVDNPFWISDDINALPYQYPNDAPGLVPGKQYSWKVLMNPNSGDPSPWSEIFTFTVQAPQITEPALSDQLATSLPTFTLTVPTDIAGYQLWIGDENDPEVSSANIFSSQTFSSLPYLSANDNDFPGLLPGETYYWKLISIDGNDNIAGNILEDYDNIGNFTIDPVNLLAPGAGQTNEPLQPIFQWEGPTGIPQYEFLLAAENDQELATPLVRIRHSGTTMQYPTNADYSLEYNQTYWWSVVPLDRRENEGAKATPRQFRTMARPLQPAPDLEAILTGPRTVQFQWSAVTSASAYRLIIAEDTEVDESGLLSNAIWDRGDIPSTPSFFSLTTDIYELDYRTGYHSQIVALDQADEMQSHPSAIIEFETGNEPGSTDQVAISVSPDPTDIRAPKISLISPVEGATSYTVKIAKNADMTEIVTTLFDKSSSEFPIVISHLADMFDYGTTYYIEVQAYKNGDIHGQPNDPEKFVVPERPGSAQSPAFSLQVPEYSTELTITLITAVEQADEYRLQIANSAGMENPVFEQQIDEGDFPYTVPANTLDYLTTYYVTLQGYRSESNTSHGLRSAVQNITLPGKPGSDEKLGFLAEYHDATQTVRFEITNSITGANAYRIRASKNRDMSELLVTLSVSAPGVVTYPDGAPALEAGKTYWFQAYAVDNNNEPHGIASNQIAISMPQPPEAPHDGTLTISPTQGEPGTEITLQATGWQTDAPPLSYQFFMKRKGESEFTIISSDARNATLTGSFATMQNTDYSFMVRVHNQSGLSADYPAPGGPEVTFTTGEPSDGQIVIEIQGNPNQ